MRRVVYTCVFGAFDRVFPPLVLEDGIDFVLITDRADLNVQGWTTQVADPERFGSPRQANRHFKMFAHRIFPEHDISLYIDGNIRPTGPMSELFDRFSGAPQKVLLPRHPRRRFVHEGQQDDAAICTPSSPETVIWASGKLSAKSAAMSSLCIGMPILL